MRPRARFSVLLFVMPLVGCTRCSDKQPDTKALDAAPPASVQTPPGAAGAGGALDAGTAGTPVTGLAAVAPRLIPAGPAPNGTWTVEFNLERVAGDENLDWSAAVARCREKGKELCLETQWQRACELDAAIGNIESWTLTADFPGAAVRGGTEGCKTRSFHKINETSPTRVGLCCDRAIAITSEDRADAFRTACTKRVLEFESALRSPNADTLGKAFADKVWLDADELDRGAALAKLAEERKGDPERLHFFDHCDVKMSDDSTPQLIANCGVVLRSQGKTRGFAQRIVFATATGPVVYLGDPKAMKPKEQKERVKSFLPSE